MYRSMALKRSAVAIGASLALVGGLALRSMTPALASAPAGIENFNPSWNSTLTTEGAEPSIIVLSDNFDGVDQFAHLTLVASQDSVQALWYVCPVGVYGSPGQSVPAAFPPSGACLQIGADTQGTIPAAPGVAVDTAYELLWDIPNTMDGVARDIVSFVCDSVIGAGDCTGQAETGVVLDDASTGSSNGPSSSGEFATWCIDDGPSPDGTCDTAPQPLGHGSTVPGLVPGGSIPLGSALRVTATFSPDVNTATLCIDPYADAFDPPNECEAPNGENFISTTQASPGYGTATFSIPMDSYPPTAEMGWYLFEDDDNFGGEADGNDGFCHTGTPLPIGAGGVPDPGEGRTCLLDSHYVVATPPSAAAPDWSQVTPADSPPARDLASMSFDQATQRVVLFGGFGSSTALADTWAFDGQDWTQLFPAHSPPARSGATMAFDPATGEIVLFGGCVEGACYVPDTWVFDGQDWTQLFPAHSPPARFGATMAFDPSTGDVVLFGGLTPSGVLSDTWVFDGQDWTQLSPAHSPPSREFAGMAMNPATGDPVLFGGSTLSTYLADTWAFDGQDWTQLSPAHSPPALVSPSLASDPATGGVLLFGGAGFSGFSSDTWAFDGQDWTQLTPAHSPPARIYDSMDFDTVTEDVVLFGGFDAQGDIFSDTWSFGLPAGAIQDTSPAASYSISATPGADQITVQDGPVVNGFQTVEIVVGSQTYDLANKRAITVQGGDGADGIVVDNPTRAAGVSSILIQGQGDSDTASVHATAPGLTTVVDLGGGTANQVSVGSTLAGISGPLVLSAEGQASAAMDDSADTSGVPASVSFERATSTTRLSGASPGDITISGIQSIRITLGSGPDSVRVFGTDPAASTAIDLGAGNDSLALSGSASLQASCTCPERGGPGTDGLYYSSYGSGVGADLGTGRATGIPSGVTGFENVAGSSFDDVLTGNGRPNALTGQGGDDLISGAGGDDLLVGGPGSDHLLGGDGSDNLRARDGVSGNDKADGGPGTDTCTADPGDTVLNCEGVRRARAW
jgi:Ca2+-binding RTX toxin-like protein